jgi:hypothetical protein
LSGRKSINLNQLKIRVTITDVWEHYETARDIVVKAAGLTRHHMLFDPSKCDPRFRGMTLREVSEHFQRMLDEIDQQTCLFIVAAAESGLRVDFYQRVRHKHRDAVSRKFSEIFQGKGKKSRLNKDILAAWTEKMPASKSHISHFRGALKYRHWLAHGRYWSPKLGRKYDPTVVFQIVENLFNCIELELD